MIVKVKFEGDKPERNQLVAVGKDGYCVGRLYHTRKVFGRRVRNPKYEDGCVEDEIAVDIFIRNKVMIVNDGINVVTPCGRVIGLISKKEEV